MGQAKYGNQVKEQNMLGYHGMICGTAFIGWRHDGALLQVTGKLADAGFHSLYRRWETNVTRFDTQVTVWFDGDPKNFISQAHRQARQWRLAKKTKRLTELFYYGAEKGNTTEVGAKGSAKWARIYDKYRNDRDIFYKDAIRYEYQHKDDIAKRVAIKVYNAAGDQPHEAIRNYVIGALAEQGVIVPLERPWGSYEHIAIPREKTDVERKLKWLSLQVKPTVEWLNASGHGIETLAALGLDYNYNCWAQEMLDYDGG